MVGQFFIIRALGLSLMDTSPPVSYPIPTIYHMHHNVYPQPWILASSSFPSFFFLFLPVFPLLLIPLPPPSSFSSPYLPLPSLLLPLSSLFLSSLSLFLLSYFSSSSSFARLPLLFLFLFLPALSLPSFLFFFLFLLFLFFSSTFLSFLLLFIFFLHLPALSLLLLILPPLLLLPLSSLLLSYPSFPLLPLSPLINIFHLNLSCEYSFCFVLLNLTCLRVAVCLSMFLLIKLLYKHIIMIYTTQTRYRTPGPVSRPSGCYHWVPGRKTAPGCVLIFLH